jgi:hypothetical protein
MTISYDCSQCPAKFKKTSYLQEHIQNNHKKYRDSFLYDCTFCYAKFSKNCHLIEHIGNVHPEKETGIILAEKIEQCHFCKLEEKIDDKGENDVPVENQKKLKLLTDQIQMNDEKFELVRNQCGRHSVSSTAAILDMSSSALYLRIRNEGIIFQKRPINKVAEEELKKHECPTCNKRFQQETSFKHHVETQHKKLEPSPPPSLPFSNYDLFYYLYSRGKRPCKNDRQILIDTVLAFYNVSNIDLSKSSIEKLRKAIEGYKKMMYPWWQKNRPKYGLDNPKFKGRWIYETFKWTPELHSGAF